VTPELQSWFAPLQALALVVSPMLRLQHKGMCFKCNEMGQYSKDCPKPKLGNGGSKVIAFTSNLA
jgi:hypothetical protein